MPSGPMPGPESSTNQCGDKLRSQGKTVALQVLKDGRPAVRPSTKGKWRALVLILVHVVMIAHFVQWWFSDRDDGVRETLAPVEPSETMYALELGQVNMGLVFFSVALLATFLFGRFFCGWGCHIIALQDLCGWAMKKVGVRPKPFRTRLLLWWPMLLALYMFVWPTFRRDILQPAFEAMKTPMPTWLGFTVPFPGFSPHFIVEDFWATFPPWFIAIPFILVCTFGAVYFLGNKGFCSYGCPYGGFFAPMDRFSIGRIVVNDNCEGCGHCTAVCTSNVRVHQEVRDFGMVVDPGCMKCLDCVSVCPNHALSFSFAKPAIAVKPRTDDARAGHLRRPEYDAPLKVEAVLFFLGIAYFVAFRGMLDSVPLLMSAGIAGILTFCSWKAWTLITVPNVRLQSIQLRLRGRFTLAGVLFLAIVCTSILTGAWSGYVRYHKWRGEQIDYRVTAEYGTVFTAGYKPDPAQKAMAEKALRHFEIAGPRNGVVGESGIGWRHNAERAVRIAWLYAVTGDLESCEAYLRFANTLAEPTTNSIHTLARVVELRGGGRAGMIEVFESELLRRPRLDAFAVDLSLLYLEVGNIEKGVAMLRQTLAHDKPPVDATTTARGADLLAQVGLRFSRADFVNEAKSAVAKALAREPDSPQLRMQSARLALFTNDRDKGREELLLLLRQSKPRPGLGEILPAAETLLQIAAQTRNSADVALVRSRLVEEAERSPTSVPVSMLLATSHAAAGDAAAAEAEFRRALGLSPGNTDIAQRLVDLMVASGRAAEAEKFVEDFERRYPPPPEEPAPGVQGAPGPQPPAGVGPPAGP